VAGNGQVNFKIGFKFPSKKISCKDMEIKKKILQGWNDKKKYLAA